jgi:hypothetical protein
MDQARGVMQLFIENYKDKYQPPVKTTPHSLENEPPSAMELFQRDLATNTTNDELTTFIQSTPTYTDNPIEW